MAINMKKLKQIGGKLNKKFVASIGGSEYVEYMGTAIAKRQAEPGKRKYIKSRATKKQALQSAARIGLAIASVGVAGSVASKAGSGYPGMRKTASGRPRQINWKGQKPSRIRYWDGR